METERKKYKRGRVAALFSDMKALLHLVSKKEVTDPYVVLHKKNTWKNRMESYAMKYIPHDSASQTVLGVYAFLSGVNPKITKKCITEQLYKNKMSNWEKYVNTYGYMEIQSSMTDLYYGFELQGAQATVQYNGCEVIATYNALVHLRADSSFLSFPDLIQYYSRHGIAYNGAFGTAPDAILKYFCKQGYQVGMLIEEEMNKENMEVFSDTYDTYIVTVYNDKNDLMQMIHTMCITKDIIDGKSIIYTLHNDGSMNQNMQTGYSKGNSIAELLCGFRRGTARCIDILGIR